MNGVAPDGGMLEHLQAEHHKLNRTLSAIEQRINDPSSGSATSHVPPDFLTALQLLRAELLAHFAEEGIDGCLGEATARCPSAAAQFKAIKANHEALLQSVDELISSVAGEEGRSQSFARRFHALSQLLHAHEIAETRLLQYALGGDVADYDVEGDD